MDWFKGLQTASKVRNWRDDEDDQKMMIKKEKELLNTLAKTLKSEKVDSMLKVETLKKLIFHPGEMNFSEITGTNFVKTIIADLDKSGVKKMAKLFKGVLLNTSKKVVKEDLERSWYNNERLKAAEGLSYLVSHEAVKDDVDFKLKYMKLLMCFGFFKIGGDDDVAVSSELAGAIKSSFYRCFSSRFSNVDNLLEVLSALCEFINSNMANEKIKEKMMKQFSKENMECWEMLMKLSQTVNKNENKTKVEKVFLILLWQLGLYLFSEPKSIEMAKSSIKELKSCYEHYKKDIKGKGKKQHKEGDLVEDEPEWIEVLVEVLLSVLSTESSILRSVVQCVFRLLWEYLTPNAIGQIISVLDPDNENNPLTYNDDESDDSNEFDDEINEGENGDTKNQSDENDSDTEVEDDEDEDMKTPEQLRLAVQKALGNAVMDSDAESIDADMIDEEEGRKLDEALSEAFKLFHQPRNKKSKEEKKDKKALSDFRIRVLDLIDIYLEKDPPMDVCLGMIAPLIRCLEFSIQDNQFKDLENRCRKTIKILTKVRKFSSTENVTIGILCDYLKSIIEKGTRSHFLFQAIGDVITHCGSFVVHCATKIVTQTKTSENESLASLVDIYKESLQSFFQNRNCSVPIIFFHSILQIDWVGNYELAPLLIENAFNSTVRQFRRNEGLELLIGFYRTLKRSKPESEVVKIKLSNIEKLLNKTIINSLNGNHANFTAKNNFFLILKKLINNIKAFHESCHLDSSLDFNKLLNTISTNKSNVMTKSKEIDVKKPITEVSLKSKKNNKKNKRKSEQVNGDHGTQNKKIKTKTNVNL
ncbi:Myb-binding protein 1A [Eumeta japonica]|uniref:Myb-binding protein 1A n=1 Tax=Eumeta variegata TaxID=151549 RepID=A0A4C1Y699_EUMVA|nr:Myb-binding protein 1A [Eumeta japonica]